MPTQMSYWPLAGELKRIDGLVPSPLSSSHHHWASGPLMTSVVSAREFTEITSGRLPRPSQCRRKSGASAIWPAQLLNRRDAGISPPEVTDTLYGSGVKPARRLTCP